MSTYVDRGDGRWEPAVPLPLYAHSWFGLRKRYVCICGRLFKVEAEYEDHYREHHIT